MADIQQWRKKIQPGKVRTPNEPDEAGEFYVASTHPNRRPLRKKRSSYFDLGQNFRATAVQTEGSLANLPSWPLDDLHPNPKPEDEMDSVMCVLMSEPYAQLDVRFNSSLMRIFESYRRMKDEAVDMEKRLGESARATQSLLSRYNMAEKDWEDEKQDYKDEIKRLEVLLAKTSRRGLAEVTIARQESKLRRRKMSDHHDHKETVFEFLEKTKAYSGKVFDNQRATMRPAPVSPTQKDRKWSQTLAQKKSMTNIHADLPFGTPPLVDMRFSLTQASYLEQQARWRTRQRAVTTSTESDDTFSSFACEGDTVQVTAGQEDTTVGDGFADLEQLARAVSRHRDVDPTHAVPQLFGAFGSQADLPSNILFKSRDTLETSPSQPQPMSSPGGLHHDQVNMKRKTVARKASDLFQRLKPQLMVDGAINMRGLQRRFSFEPGDDGATRHAPPTVETRVNEENRAIRKSVSVDALRNHPTTCPCPEKALSPVPSSPTMSTLPNSDGRPPSRIPTPVYSSGSLAKPRQEREDSAASLLTAIRNGDDACRRSQSVASSMSSAKAEEPSHNKVSPHGDFNYAVGNRLIEHTKSLRSNMSSGRLRSFNLSTGARPQAGPSSDHSNSGSDSRQETLQSATPTNSAMRLQPK